MHLPFANTFEKKYAHQRGASAVEMALLLPLLLLMLDGVLEFGLILHNQSVLTSATSMAARAGIAQSTPKLSNTQIAAVAFNASQDALISLNPTSAPTVTVVQALDPTYLTPLQVSASYTFKGLLIGGLLGVFQINPTLSVTTVMYNE
jgi:Flp pilus assembly protein TadG